MQTCMVLRAQIPPSFADPLTLNYHHEVDTFWLKRLYYYWMYCPEMYRESCPLQDK